MAPQPIAVSKQPPDPAEWRQHWRREWHLHRYLRGRRVLSWRETQLAMANEEDWPSCRPPDSMVFHDPPPGTGCSFQLHTPHRLQTQQELEQLAVWLVHPLVERQEDQYGNRRMQ